MPVYQFQHIPAGGHDSTAFLYENTTLTGQENGSPRLRATIARQNGDRADVAEWADARDLKSRAFGHVGSSPTVGTTGARKPNGPAQNQARRRIIRRRW
jgi:hypothetical protein